jgi:formylglycine-generating enzyme required for sulfatase activity/serine/threonine protein kinase
MVGTSVKLLLQHRDGSSGARSYRLVRSLGEGSYGEVYLAQEGHLGRWVTVKLLRRSDDPQAGPRMKDEARLLASVQHPHIVQVEALGEADGRLALVTEFVEGQDLTACLDGPQRMPASALLEVAQDLASALEAAWNGVGLVHRDIKPGNIRIGLHGHVKLLDFGLARAEDIAREAGSTQQPIGTIAYFPPERFDVRAAPHPESDVFSLGCVLVRGWTQAHFYEEPSWAWVARLAVSPGWERYLEGRLVRILPEGLRGSDLHELLLGMLARDPAARPTAAQIWSRCEARLARWEGRTSLRAWCRARAWPEEARAPRPQPESRPDPAPGTRRIIDCGGARLDLVWVPPGRFWMGATRAAGQGHDPDAQDDEGPVRQVTLTRGFWLGRHPVTVAQYAAFCAATGRARPEFARPEHAVGDLPVTMVDWQDARAFAAWLRAPEGLTAALPTEAEWEWAARGPDGRRFPWGAEPPDPSRACFSPSRQERERARAPRGPAPVGERAAGRSPFGAEDMAGNVWEWCADAWGDEHVPDLVDPCRRDEDPEALRVVRGGSWLRSSRRLRAAHRFWERPGLRGGSLGFRVLLRR